MNALSQIPTHTASVTYQTNYLSNFTQVLTEEKYPLHLNPQKIQLNTPTLSSWACLQSWGAPVSEALYSGVPTTNALADYTNIHIKLGHIDPLLNGPSSLSLLSKFLLL